MTFDLPTMLGVLGVLLTIAFFGVGYRQTIGARRERARAANRAVVDALFKRLTLESAFVLGLTEIDKMLLGGALSASVNTSDMMKPTDVESLVLFRIIESDYISTGQRKEVLDRLASCFKVDKVEKHPPRHEFETRGAKAATPEALLGVVSAILAVVATSIVGLSTITGKGGQLRNLSHSDFIPLVLPLAVGVIAIAFTGLALILTARLRDAVRTESSGETSLTTQSRILEAELYRRASRISRRFNITAYPWADFEFTSQAGKFAVEIKQDVNRMPAQILARIVERIENECRENGFSGAFIVSAKSPQTRARQASSEHVKIIDEADLMNLLRS